MRNATILLAVVAVLAMSVPAYGVYVSTKWTNAASDNDYHNDANWDTTYDGTPGFHMAPPETNDGNMWSVNVPKAGADYAKITKGSYSWKFYVGYWTVSKVVMDPGTYTVRPGSCNIGETHVTPCEWIQKGGTLDGGFTIGRDNGNSPYGNGWGEYTIEGGTFSGGGVTLAANNAYYGLFKVVGATPAVNLSGYKQNPIGTYYSSGGVKGDDSKGGNLEVVLKDGGNGVSVINCTVGNGEATLSGTLHVDVTDYTGTETVIDILTATVLTYKDHTETYDPDGKFGPLGSTEWPDLVLSADNITAGYTLGDNGSGTLQVTIPEPATLCLLGLGGIGVLLRKRR